MKTYIRQAYILTVFFSLLSHALSSLCNSECLVQYATNCNSTSSCCPGLECQVNHDLDSTQCLEPLKYQVSVNSCFITNYKPSSSCGCKNSGECCNPAASCIDQTCVLPNIKNGYVSPSALGAYTPSFKPSVFPTLSLDPTVTPTNSPSTPTLVPSNTPTAPTVEPTTQPSTSPSTFQPSMPSISPSLLPSTQPSETPTSSIPSIAPSLEPSFSLDPSNMPSAYPTTPTIVPTLAPSLLAVEYFQVTQFMSNVDCTKLPLPPSKLRIIARAIAIAILSSNPNEAVIVESTTCQGESSGYIIYNVFEKGPSLYNTLVGYINEVVSNGNLQTTVQAMAIAYNVDPYKNVTINNLPVFSGLLTSTPTISPTNAPTAAPSSTSPHTSVPIAAKLKTVKPSTHPSVSPSLKPSKAIDTESESVSSTSGSLSIMLSTIIGVLVGAVCLVFALACCGCFTDGKGETSFDPDNAAKEVIKKTVLRRVGERASMSLNSVSKRASIFMFGPKLQHNDAEVNTNSDTTSTAYSQPQSANNLEDDDYCVSPASHSYVDLNITSDAHTRTEHNNSATDIKFPSMSDKKNNQSVNSKLFIVV